MCDASKCNESQRTGSNKIAPHSSGKSTDVISNLSAKSSSTDASDSAATFRALPHGILKKQSSTDQSERPGPVNPPGHEATSTTATEATPGTSSTCTSNQQQQQQQQQQAQQRQPLYAQVSKVHNVPTIAQATKVDSNTAQTMATAGEAAKVSGDHSLKLTGDSEIEERPFDPSTTGEDLGESVDLAIASLDQGDVNEIPPCDHMSTTSGMDMMALLSPTSMSEISIETAGAGTVYSPPTSPALSSLIPPAPSIPPPVPLDQQQQPSQQQQQQQQLQTQQSESQGQSSSMDVGKYLTMPRKSRRKASAKSAQMAAAGEEADIDDNDIDDDNDFGDEEDGPPHGQGGLRIPPPLKRGVSSKITHTLMSLRNKLESGPGPGLGLGVASGESGLGQSYVKYYTLPASYYSSTSAHDDATVTASGEDSVSTSVGSGLGT